MMESATVAAWQPHTAGPEEARPDTSELAHLAGMRQEMVSKIETDHEGTKLSSIFALFAALDLELVVDTRSGRASQNIEDIF